MPRYLWYLDEDGWPLERIDTRTGEHVPLITGDPDGSLHPRTAGAPSPACYPRREGGCSVLRLLDPGSGESS
jgi:hypothetical protein